MSRAYDRESSLSYVYLIPGNVCTAYKKYIAHINIFYIYQYVCM